ncbi:MAG: SpoIIIAH-like family protein [Lachnospiraceae bacterium]
MKAILKKNQLIITALAVMIAVAGYLKYSDSMIDSDMIAANTSAVETVTDEIVTDPEIETELETEISMEDIYTAADSLEESPGEAVFTGSDVTVSSGFASEAKLNREQTRSKNKESLLEIINSSVVSESQKQEAIDQMLELTTIAERETGTETLLEAKGFEDVLVSISDNKVDVVVNQSQVSDTQRAQIEDVVSRKTGISPENIVITPVQVDE